MSGCRYRVLELDHTADLAIWVWGASLPDLYAAAMRGMQMLMIEPEGQVASEWRKIRLEALDRESLLVDWLNELLFIMDTEALVVVEARIDSLSDSALVATVGVAPGEVTKAHIKAATFHNLAIREGESGWSTEITFDV